MVSENNPFILVTNPQHPLERRWQKRARSHAIANALQMQRQRRLQRQDNFVQMTPKTFLPTACPRRRDQKVVSASEVLKNDHDFEEPSTQEIDADPSLTHDYGDSDLVVETQSVPQQDVGFGSDMVSALTAMFGTLSAIVPLHTCRDVIQYSFTVIYPRLLGNLEACRTWFVLFCQQKVIFHAFKYADILHRSILRDSTAPKEEVELLKHRGETFRLLIQITSGKDTSSLEVILLTMLVLTINGIRLETRGGSSLFWAHWPTANWLSVYGRLQPQESHLQAMKTLITHVGGLQALESAPLAATIALADLLIASQRGARPIFPQYWTTDRSVLVRSLHMDQSLTSAPGRGFFVSVPGGLPPKTLAVFVRLAHIDRLMCRSRGLDSGYEKYESILRTRNAIHHELLCLLPWDQLPADDKHRTIQSCYEICRQAATLYSSAVVFGLPHDVGWQALQAQSLKRVLEPIELHTTAGVAIELYLWALGVGAMSTFGSPDSEFFTANLRFMLQRYGTQKRQRMLSILNDFAWPQSGHEDDFKAFYDAII